MKKRKASLNDVQTTNPARRNNLPALLPLPTFLIDSTNIHYFIAATSSGR